MIVAAHDEEDVIERRLENLLELDYPAERVEIVVASDASTDGTDAIVEELAEREPRVRLIRCPRGGKVAAQNLAVRETRGRDRRLLRCERDLGAGRAAGARAQLRRSRGRVRLRAAPPRDADGTNREGAYWRYELVLREPESQLGSVTGGNGSIYAVRRSDYVDVDPRFGHDLSFPYLMVQRGRRAVYEPEALAFEKPTPRHRGRVPAQGADVRALLADRCSRAACCATSPGLPRRARLAPPSPLRRAACSTSPCSARASCSRSAEASIGSRGAGSSRCSRDAARRPGIARYYTLVTWGTVESLKNYAERGVPAVWDKAPGTR